MTEYITKNDKNGKPRFYKVIDGKMKLIGRAEYEANTAAVEEAESVAEVNPGEAALEAVKSIVSGMDGCDENKVKTQSTKHSVLINYRNCMVCALVYGDDGEVTAIKFMGTSIESRKKAELLEVKDLAEYAEKIAEQVVFIDWWWANATRKKVA